MLSSDHDIFNGHAPYYNKSLKEAWYNSKSKSFNDYENFKNTTNNHNENNSCSINISNNTTHHNTKIRKFLNNIINDRNKKSNNNNNNIGKDNKTEYSTLTEIQSTKAKYLDTDWV